MALNDYELNLQTEIVSWKCSRYADCLMKFIRTPRHLKLGMRGLVWSIEALPLQRPNEFSFKIMQVKRSRTPLSLSEAAAPNLHAKFELLLLGFKASMKSVCRADEALDKLFAFSRFFCQAEEDKRWWIILDAELTATACMHAREALYQTAQVAAVILVENLVQPPVFIGGEQSEICDRSGWWIDNWTVTDEFWANSFFPRDSWKFMMRLIQAKAVERGNVVQWCTVQVFDKPNPYFQFEVALHEFLEGDNVLLRIGVASDRVLRVQVFLTEAVEVVCSQEGLETGTSLGLAYLLPGVVKDYIRISLERNEAELSNNNVVQGLLRHLIRYLVFLGKICVICGSDRLLEIPRNSTCSNICKARKQGYEAAIAGCLPELKILKKARATRREQYVKNLYTNSKEGHTGLAILLNADVVDDEDTSKNNNENAIGYEKAVGEVIKMNTISDLWIEDAESFESYSAFW